jgi:hypothetical protein
LVEKKDLTMHKTQVRDSSGILLCSDSGTKIAYSYSAERLKITSYNTVLKPENKYNRMVEKLILSGLEPLIITPESVL